MFESMTDDVHWESLPFIMSILLKVRVSTGNIPLDATIAVAVVIPLRAWSEACQAEFQRNAFTM